MNQLPRECIARVLKWVISDAKLFVDGRVMLTPLTPTGDQKYWRHTTHMWQRCTRVCKRWREVCWWPPLFTFYIMQVHRRGIHYALRDTEINVTFYHDDDGFKYGPQFFYDRLHKHIRVSVLVGARGRAKHPTQRMCLTFQLLGDTLLYPSRYHDPHCEGFVLSGEKKTKINNDRQFYRFMFTADVLVPLFQYALSKVLLTEQIGRTLHPYEVSFFIDEWRTRLTEPHCSSE